TLGAGIIRVVIVWLRHAPKVSARRRQHRAPEPLNKRVASLTIRLAFTTAHRGSAVPRVIGTVSPALCDQHRNRQAQRRRRPWPTQRMPDLGPASYFSKSEEHTSELQSRFELVCRLLLEKKKTAP